MKIFGTSDFGYHRITVERPLKLRFEITEDTLAALKHEGRWPNGTAASLVEALAVGRLGVADEERRRLRTTRAGRSAGAPGRPGAMLKGIWGAVSVSDPEGEVQQAKDGTPLPDPDLRDYENVPLDEDIDAYFAREVIPHVPTPGSTTTRPRSATKSPSPATSTSTSHPGRSPRSTPNYAT